MMQWHPGGANLSNLPHVAMTPNVPCSTHVQHAILCVCVLRVCVCVCVFYVCVCVCVCS